MKEMTGHTQIAARLSAELVSEIDRTADADLRSRTDQIAYLALLGLAGRERLKSLERLANSTIESASARADAAGAEHLREHARLCGLTSPTQESNDER